MTAGLQGSGYKDAGQMGGSEGEFGSREVLERRWTMAGVKYGFVSLLGSSQIQ